MLGYNVTISHPNTEVQSRIITIEKPASDRAELDRLERLKRDRTTGDARLLGDSTSTSAPVRDWAVGQNRNN